MLCISRLNFSCDMDSIFVLLESKHNHHVFALAEITLYYSMEYTQKILMLGTFTGRHGKRSLIKVILIPVFQLCYIHKHVFDRVQRIFAEVSPY